MLEGKRINVRAKQRLGYKVSCYMLPGYMFMLMR